MSLSDRRTPHAGVGGAHPDAQRLAEYADKVLDPAARADVERHLATCADCRTVLVDAMAALAAERVRPFPIRRFGLAAATGLAAAAALVLAIRFQDGNTDTDAARQQLVTAIGREPTRPVEGRLAGLPYKPPAARSGAEAESSPDVRIAALEIEKAARDRETPDDAATLGLAQAALGNIDAAVAALERAVRDDPKNARHLSDLSAMYAARAQRLNRPRDYELALTTAERALDVDRAQAEACFNLALALQRLARANAREAWERCRSTEPDPAWAREIGDRVAALQR